MAYTTEYEFFSDPLTCTGGLALISLVSFCPADALPRQSTL